MHRRPFSRMAMITRGACARPQLSPKASPTSRKPAQHVAYGKRSQPGRRCSGAHHSFSDTTSLPTAFQHVDVARLGMFAAARTPPVYNVAGAGGGLCTHAWVSVPLASDRLRVLTRCCAHCNTLVECGVGAGTRYTHVAKGRRRWDGNVGGGRVREMRAHQEGCLP